MPYPRPLLEPIALVGSSCRFAGNIKSPHELWKQHSKPEDLSRPVPPSRFSSTAFFHEDGEYHGTTNSVKAYWLEQDHRLFDAQFFNITPKEAEAIDPQQRLLLEVVYESLESAGYTLQQYAGQPVAVFAGVMTDDYHTLSSRDDLNASQYAATGNARSNIANRVSYFFDFHGPSMTIDTACSASLVALHQAVQSLRSGETTMACVAGVNLMLTPEQFIAESNLHMLSPTGHSRMWDAKADGYARGEGVVSVLIKTLSRALADGDNIQAIIRETGVNSDGRTKGITMPNPHAQTALIKETYRKSGLDTTDPEHRPQFFEAHGTGTPVGDPLEARAIYDAFFSGSEDKNSSKLPASSEQKLLVGSVKTIIGHTEGAAGLAGLLKVVQCLKAGSILPNLHLESLSPTVMPFSDRLHVPTASAEWPAPASGHPRRASVNSFGFGGTNAHAIIEVYNPDIHNTVAHSFNPELSERLSNASSSVAIAGTGSNMDSDMTLPLLFSAASEKSLRGMLHDYRAFILNNSNIGHKELAWHLYCSRTVHNYRVAITAGDLAQGAAAMDSVAILQKQLHPQPRILGIFTGQGAQYAGMSKGLYRVSSVYRNTIQCLDTILQTCADPPAWSIAAQLMISKEDSQIHTAAISQPLCTALQIGLVDFLKSIGISFACVVGHSSGEIAAAYAAGRITQRQAMLISYYRGRYTHLAAGKDGQKGGMLACGLSRQQAEEFCSQAVYKDRICVAASNSQTLTTLAGDSDAILAASSDLKEQNTFARVLNVDTAYHSFHMNKPVEEYCEALKDCHFEIYPPCPASNQTQWISSVHGSLKEVKAEDLAVSYWGNNMTCPVLFQDALAAALRECGPFNAAIEVGPHPALKLPATETMKEVLGTSMPYMFVLSRVKEDRLTVAEFIGQMWADFGPSSVDIGRFVSDSACPSLVDSRILDAPSYSWDHSQIHWRESRPSEQYHFRKHSPHELLGVRTMDDTQFDLRWRNILKMDKLPWLKGHKFQGQALLPASAYCVMALDAARAVLEGYRTTIVELQDLEFLNGITLEPDSLGVETLFSLSMLPPEKGGSGQPQKLEGHFKLTSTPVRSFDMKPMKLNFQGKLHVLLEETPVHSLPRRQEKSRAETLPVKIDNFYQMMEGLGLEYTGPFKALRSIDRRLNYAAATLDSRHPSDSTRLSVSPATLDACFHTAFATFSSPGDRALWTSFLPTNIEKIRFSLDSDALVMTGATDLLSVDSHLTSFKPYSRECAATITADMEIFNQLGEMQIQIEGLVVSSFASTKPEDDYELYLHTVLELDPEDEIVHSTTSDLGFDPSLAESCMRVAQHYTYKSRFTASLDTPPASPKMSASPGPDTMTASTTAGQSFSNEEDVQDFIRTSPYFFTLDYIRNVSVNRPEAVFSTMKKMIEEAQETLRFQKHLKRVVRQVAHRYPRMNVLGVTDPQYGFTEPILKGLGDVYRTYTIGGKAEDNLYDRMPSIKGSRKVRQEFVALNPEHLDETPAAHRYDMVIWSVSTPGNHGSDPRSPWETIRGMIKDGGFLLLINLPLEQPTNTLLETSILDEDSSEVLPATPPDRSSSEEACKFFTRPRNSEFSTRLGMSLSVLQATVSSYNNSTNNDQMRSPLAWRADELATQHLLIIGGENQAIQGIATEVEQCLGGYCNSISTAARLDDVTPEVAANCTGIIFLTDLEDAICSSMSEKWLDALRSLVRPEMVILWVTRNAREDPERAASLGLTRTLKAETPDLLLQVLDLDTLDDSGKLISETFCRLGFWAQSSQRKEPDSIVWSNEPEIHMQNGRRFIPRVLPFRPAIDRLNAYRRSVTTTVNTLESCIVMEPNQDRPGSIRYKALDVGHTLAPTGSVLTYAEYSSVRSFAIGEHGPMHLCVGRTVDDSNLVMGLTSSLASIVDIDASLCREISMLNVDLSRMTVVLSTVLAALQIVMDATKPCLVLIEPPPLLQQAVHILASEGYGGKGLHMHPWSRQHKSTLEQAPVKDTLVTHVHPLAGVKEVRRALPKCGECVQAPECAVFDFLPEEDQLSRTLTTLGGQVEYHTVSRANLHLDMSSHLVNATEDKLLVAIWEMATNLAFRLMSEDSSQMPSSSFITPAHLLEPAVPTPQSALVDWKSQRDIELPVAPLVQTVSLRSDRTYILFGLTRDLGQSICRLFLEHGARHIIVASRNPDMNPAWVTELNEEEGAHVRTARCDITVLEDVRALAATTGGTNETPTVGGIVNGAMVLDDRVFAQMDMDTWNRVMRPKTVGSRNLDLVFDSADLEFFIMTSSFAAIGGHAGQSNYAAANMFMNGLAVSRRRRNLAASVLNIGVIYGLGLLARERQQIYGGLERDGYPPISERDIHHMFIEAIDAGRPFIDLTTGLARYRINDANPQHWHRDLRFSHYTLPEDGGDDGEGGVAAQQGDGQQKQVKDLIRDAETLEAATDYLVASFCRRMEITLQLPANSAHAGNSITEMGVDSLAAVEIRNWFYKTVGTDVPVMKILSASSILSLCHEIAQKIKS
ncbi:hypothetical protein M406DRAFT_338852 [Cryphonectria parasitica EP155]|uniref:Polyketide synthase n=1 Tax=Cryphonectria parasitica (strain ATCC 38755 / EP155) TaxID=660469 RepID=A0A9P4Y3B2_CRYP1|nr:uncharacterized protein M406DRAFT_338852 [Cryphonectria parasitica EP155]KAF3765375.1 hypothetical protein M406DRAFT_338852 [Cryphonectria parasitica EP155]